jgi:AraC family transcriptional regulator of arabinose operon
MPYTNNKPNTLRVNIPVVPLIIAGSFSEVRGYHAWRPNGTQDWLMIATVDGAGRYGHSTGDFTTSPGEITLIKPGTVHDYGVYSKVGHWMLLWAHFHPRPHWSEWLEWPIVAPGLMRLTMSESTVRQEVFQLFEQVYELTLSDRSQREAYAMNKLELLLIKAYEASTGLVRLNIDNRVEAVKNYIAGNLAEPVSINTLAEVADLSVSRIGHLFRDNTGLTPQQFWEQQRMIRAQQLLNLTDRSVQAVAAEVGYDNAYYFSNRFKRFTGSSPTEYRRKCR